MKRIGLIFLLFSISALGQVGREYPQVPARLVEYFQLTPEQSAQIRTINQQFDSYTDQADGRISDLEDALLAETLKVSPDPLVVGGKFVEIIKISREIGLEERSVVGKVQAVLNDIQKPKLKALDDARKLQTTIANSTSWFFLDRFQTTSSPGAVPAEEEVKDLPTEIKKIRDMTRRSKQ